MAYTVSSIYRLTLSHCGFQSKILYFKLSGTTHSGRIQQSWKFNSLIGVCLCLWPFFFFPYGVGSDNFVGTKTLDPLM